MMYIFRKWSFVWSGCDFDFGPLPSLFRFKIPSATALNVSSTDGLYPSAVPSVDTNNVFLMPMFLGLYTLLGLLDIGLYDDLASAPENEVTIAALSGN